MSATAHPVATAVPTDNLAAELRAILTGVAFAPLDDIRWLRVTGPDAARWLNGMVTNSIQSLATGEGCYNFLLNAQGRILGDCTIYRDPTPEQPAFLLETDAAQIETIQTHLDRFIIMDDVELANISDGQTGIVVSGPDALATVQQIGGTSCAADASSTSLPTTITLKQTTYHDSPVSLIFTPNQLVPRFAICGGAETVAAISAELAPTPSISSAAREALRILSGTPRYGVDIRNDEAAHDLPQETAQDARALHFAKGCYLGQEIVERIRSRGSVHRTFTGFVLNGEFPLTGAELTTESQPRPVGELTSITAIPRASFDASATPDAPPLQIALGYIRREALDRNLSLAYPGGTATPIELPFRLG